MPVSRMGVEGGAVDDGGDEPLVGEDLALSSISALSKIRRRWGVYVHPVICPMSANFLSHDHDLLAVQAAALARLSSANRVGGRAGTRWLKIAARAPINSPLGSARS